MEIWDSSDQTWTSLEEAVLQEATSYKWRCKTQDPFQLHMQGIPLPMVKVGDDWTGTIETPFQCGTVRFTLISNETKEISQFIYPDNRKMLLQDYEQMLADILEEGMICFQAEGLERDVTASGRTNKPSYLQWQYIKNNMLRLRKIFKLIENNPIRVLKREDRLLKKEQVKTVTQRTASWIERYGQRYGWTQNSMPNHIQTNKAEETYQTYENQVVLTQLLQLRQLLLQYRGSDLEEMESEAQEYLDWISFWLTRSFLKNVSPFNGTIRTSQAFRKHPYYKEWFKWFQSLYEFQNVSFDMDQSLGLKDTYDIYEIWAYLQVVKVLRELDLIENYQGLFVKEEERFFLSLGKNKESRMKLKGEGYLTFQRLIQNNSKPFYTYTQRMIPDITIEYKDEMVIFDPKYRVDSNIPNALAEMHKYRDGIIQRETGERVVTGVYILTPRQATYSEEKDFYSKEYQEKYGMGAFLFKPGSTMDEFRSWMER
ncbi:DUF2357 domain-containing protein [Bacillus alkalicola]|uniref:Restriction endonuclease-like protein n=1 Tax=Evansella alkalicola TaxID=745819 RepID=A0ABS6K0J6_9BACI|nr:DUF2357 domain-containing protein [Bacillus alkalicola]MBU9723826.1 restriction endonuclease-like protein [Bacillus alkalicola]